MSPGAIFSRIFLVTGILTPLTATASPDDPDVTADHVKHDGVLDFAYIHGNLRGVQPAGTRHWVIPQTVLATGGLERKFDSYSADPTVGLRVGSQYRYDFGPLQRTAVLNATDDDAGKELASRKVRYIHELYGRYYPDPQKPVAEAPDIRAAFQIALWELICETDVPDGPMPFHLYTGTFRADYPDPATAPPAVRLAQEYVQSLTGNDDHFYSNPLFGGSEIVRLDGLGTTTTTMVSVPRPTWYGNGCCVCEGVTYDLRPMTTTEYAQSQLVIRLASGAGDASRGEMFNEGAFGGGSGGSVLSGGLGGGRPIGAGGSPGGFPSGGPGSGFAAPGLIGTPGGFGGGPNDSTNPPTGTPPTDTPPVGTPPLGEDRNPPGGDNNPPGGDTNPPGGDNNPPPGVDNPPPGVDNPPPEVDNPPPAVPAPPGVIVGLIAVGVLAVRRIQTRRYET